MNKKTKVVTTILIVYTVIVLGASLFMGIWMGKGNRISQLIATRPPFDMITEVKLDQSELNLLNVIGCSNKLYQFDVPLDRTEATGIKLSLTCFRKGEPSREILAVTQPLSKAQLKEALRVTFSVSSTTGKEQDCYLTIQSKSGMSQMKSKIDFLDTKDMGMNIINSQDIMVQMQEKLVLLTMSQNRYGTIVMKPNSVPQTVPATTPPKSPPTVVAKPAPTQTLEDNYPEYDLTYEVSMTLTKQ